MERNKEKECKSWLRKQMEFLVPLHLITNFEIQKYHQNESRFNSVYIETICLKNKGWGLCDKP